MSASDRKTFSDAFGTKEGAVTLKEMSMFSNKPRYTVPVEKINPLETKIVFNENKKTFCQKISRCCRRG